MFEIEQNKLEEKIKAFCEEQSLPDVEIKWARIPFSAHWGLSTSFFAMAAAEARQGKKVIVPKRAQEIAEAAADYLGTLAGFEKIEAVRGYLNLYFSTPSFTQKVLDQVLSQGDGFGRSPARNERVLVEFSQPNTHKAFHVGHLRNVILGTAVCNVLEFGGYDVVRANYIGDIGLHVIKWLWNYMKHHDGETPGEDKVRWMGDIYSEADRYYSDDPAVEREVRELFARWHNGDPEIEALWEKTRQWSLEAFDQVYDLLGVHFDHYYFESEMEKPGNDLVDTLIEKGIARDERPDGAVIVPLDELLGLDEDYRVLVILRSDGTSLYATKDIPLAMKKFEDYQIDKSIYVIDVRQSLYMRQIFKTLELMGHQDYAEKCFHLAYEIVNLPGNVTMSSRDGTVVLLEDLVREATERARGIVAEKNPELSDAQQAQIAKAVALGAIKYSMLSRDNTKVVTFDWEKAMDFNGQAAPYIQYAYVRAGSILRRTDVDVSVSMLPEDELHPAEVELIELITRVPDEIRKAAEEYRPLYVANIAFDLAKGFSNFYNQCPVLKAEEPVRSMRLRLVAAARQSIKNCLAVLGIEAPEAM